MVRRDRVRGLRALARACDCLFVYDDLVVLVLWILDAVNISNLESCNCGRMGRVAHSLVGLGKV